MELANQIKKYRTDLHLSQEELAEKVYVTRQTISNWENEKSYPDIHSLLLLSSVFQVSLDQLIKGDVTIMKEQINKEELKQFDRDGNILAVFFLLMILTFIPLTKFLGVYGWIIALVLWLAGLSFAIRVEKFKKKHDIQTYKEIVAFTEGKRLDEIEKARESGKRPYQKILSACICGLIALLICILFEWLL